MSNRSEGKTDKQSGGRGPKGLLRRLGKNLFADGLEEIKSENSRLEERIAQLEKKLEQTAKNQTQQTKRAVENWTWERYQRTETLLEVRLEELRRQLTEQTAKQVEDWTWDRYQRVEALVEVRLEELRRQLAEQTGKQVEDWTWDRYEKLAKQVEDWTWERYQRTATLIENARQGMEDRLVQTVNGRVWSAEERLIRKEDSLLWNILYEMDSDKIKRISSGSSTYDLTFYWNNRYGSIHSAQRVLRKVFAWTPHRSVADLGCGTGTWLWAAKTLGAETVLGIDGDYVPRELLLIPEECFVPGDLERPAELPSRFDLAMSLEVAEHLHPEAADTFVASLCRASDVVLFSAAHPGQGGDGHINEQPIEYWIEKFSANGYRFLEIRPFFQGDLNIEFWYRDNVSLFVKAERYDALAKTIEAWQDPEA